ncbi:unnamed protein product [Bursaphelenchus okinawaensis]|uniref:Uncharacterized protein n=1 Tax=Bursaphelenchus okinawaensis TaxID=465554 RepID=A0A811LA27_9BILA|nr:unnamed protein product [Bursaphelenchus okinawaensis]CAG9119960.1 unnamed protein product [Bursaphelenchus okinawaensis]
MKSPMKGKSPYKKSPHKNKSPFKVKTFNSPLLSKTALKRRHSRVSLLFQKIGEGSRKSSIEDSENQEPVFNQPKKKIRRQSSPERIGVKVLPQDLRLGCKLIVKSSKPFSFSPKTLQPTYEHEVRLSKTVSKYFLHNNKVTKDPEHLLQASCFYYQFPPEKFPRLEGSIGLGRTDKRIHPVTKEDAEVTGLKWLDAFEDLYTMWKDHDLDSFYVCSTTFTVLFIKHQKSEIATTEDIDPGETSCMGFSEFTQYKAVITPSSRSLRKLFNESEISYTRAFVRGEDTVDSMPSFNESYSQDNLDVSSFSLQSQKTERATTPETSFTMLEAPKPEDEYISPMKLGEDATNDDFLRTIGLSPSVVVKSETRDSQSCSQFTDQNTQDTLNPSAGTTLVLSDISSIDAFRSLLCNNKTGWVRTGPESGTPPTLICAQQFLNAPLSSLKLRTQKLRKEKNQYVLEIFGGPILPHLPQKVSEYLEKVNCLTTNATLHFHVNGRDHYDGLNEAVSFEMKNINNYSYDTVKAQYEY